MNLKKKQKKILEDEMQLNQTYNELHKAIKNMINYYQIQFYILE